MSTSSTNTTPTGGGANTGSPSPTSSHTDSDTATLYLFTFLATILILILLSASLVLRSYVLRRRYRQRFHQALADGLFADHGLGQFDTVSGFRRSARRFGPKPVVWDTWIQPTDKDGTWSSITPVAVALLSPPASSTPSPQPSIPSRGSPSPLQSQPPFLSQLHFHSTLSHSLRSSPPPSRQGQSPIRSPTLSSTITPPATPDSNTNTHPEKDVAKFSVCVLIAMPNASAPIHRPACDGKGKHVDLLEPQARPPSDDAALLRPRARTANDDKGLPLLEFGVVQLRTAEWT